MKRIDCSTLSDVELQRRIGAIRELQKHARDARDTADRLGNTGEYRILVSHCAHLAELAEDAFIELYRRDDNPLCNCGEVGEFSIVGSPGNEIFCQACLTSFGHLPDGVEVLVTASGEILTVGVLRNAPSEFRVCGSLVTFIDGDLVHTADGHRYRLVGETGKDPGPATGTGTDAAS